MIRRATQPGRLSSSEDGFVIVAVLWFLAALASLAVLFSMYLSSSARGVSLNDTALQAEALISAGVELTAYELRPPARDARPAKGSFQTRLNGVDLAVSYVPELVRIDLNAAPKELLSGLLSVLGASDDDAKQFADRIVGWRSKETPGNYGGEDALYLAAGRDYAPRHAPFVHVNELQLVLGLPPALVERALNFVTVFSGASGVDVLNAPPEVIGALPGMTPLVLKQFLSERASLPNDPQAIAAALGDAKGSATKEKSQAYRLWIRARFPNRREVTSEVVISLRGDEEPYRVLYWQDDTWPRRRRLVHCEGSKPCFQS